MTYTLVAKVKEKKMANKKMFWLGILVMVLVFGMTVVGCDDGSTNGGSSGTDTQNPGGNNPGGNNPGGNDSGGDNPVNPFIGTWKASGSAHQLVFTSNTVKANWAPLGSGTGTYTYSGNSAIINYGATVNVTISNNSIVFPVITANTVFYKQ